MAGGVNYAARCRTWKSITNSFAATPGDDSEENLITLCTVCHNETHKNVALKRKKSHVPD